MLQGARAQEGDTAVGSTQLYWAGQAHMFLDNLSRNEGGRCVAVEQLEERLTQVCDTAGEERLKRIRDDTGRLAPLLGRQAEANSLAQKIGAILGTRQVSLLASSTARSFAASVDSDRIARFDQLVRVLRTQPLPVVADPAMSGPAVAHFAFLERSGSICLNSFPRF